MRRWAWAAVVLGLGGCGGAELAVVGAANSGAEAGATVWRAGKLDATFRADGDTVREAVLWALEDLQIPVLGVAEPDPRRWVIRGEDAKERDYVLRVDERSPRMTQLQVDVGWFSSRGTAELLLRRVMEAPMMPKDTTR